CRPFAARRHPLADPALPSRLAQTVLPPRGPRSHRALAPPRRARLLYLPVRLAALVGTVDRRSRQTPDLRPLDRPDPAARFRLRRRRLVPAALGRRCPLAAVAVVADSATVFSTHSARG